MSLLECTNNRFWGTGWFLDDNQWSSSASYPGKNVLGTLLESIRDSFDMDVLNATKVIKGIEPMDTGASGNDKTLSGDNDNGNRVNVGEITQIKAPTLIEGKVSFAKLDKCKPIKPTAKEMAGKIIATTVGSASVVTDDTTPKGIMNKVTEARKSETKSDGSVTSDEILEADNFDSVSFTSSIFSDGNDSLNARNVTLSSGRLDVDKLMSWSLPPVNLSRVLDRSVGRSPATREKILIDAPRKSSSTHKKAVTVLIILLLRLTISLW